MGDDAARALLARGRGGREIVVLGTSRIGTGGFSWAKIPRSGTQSSRLFFSDCSRAVEFRQSGPSYHIRVIFLVMKFFFIWQSVRVDGLADLFDKAVSVVRPSFFRPFSSAVARSAVGAEKRGLWSHRSRSADWCLTDDCLRLIHGCQF